MHRIRIIQASLLLLCCVWHTAAAQDPRVTHKATVVTSAGTIEIELYGKDAPKTVENFVALASKNFYNGILFHRVITGMVIQGGDPLTRDATRRDQWGTGGESSFGAPFADELNPGAPSYQRGYVQGTVAMANRGPNTNTSQFFIMLTDNNSLPHKLEKRYTIFGRVTRGLDVVQKIGQGAVADKQRGIPVSPISITSVTVTAAH